MFRSRSVMRLLYKANCKRFDAFKSDYATGGDTKLYGKLLSTYVTASQNQT